MSSDLERRVTRALLDLPGSTPEAERAARRAALEGLPRRGRRRRFASRRALVLVGASLALLGAGAAALAAIGVEVRLGPAKRVHRAAPSRLELPHGAHGFAVFARGKLWLATRTGVQIQGLGVSAVALSPRALFVAVGLGHQLVAMAPSGRHAWARRTPGRVLAAAWSPDGLKIAYVVEHVTVRAADRNELHLIEGDGDHDRVLDVGVAAVAPAWRPDSLSVAYAGTGGRAIVYDLGHRSRSLVEARCPSPGPVRVLGFAPAGRRLVAVTQSGILLAVGSRPRAKCLVFRDHGQLSGGAWLGPHDFVTTERLRVPLTSVRLRRWVLDASGHAFTGGSACTAAGVISIASAPSGRELALALRNADGNVEVRELRAGTNWFTSCSRLAKSRLLLELRQGAAAELAWR